MKPETSIQRIAPSPARDSDTIRVFIRDCRVALRIGIYASEMHTTQPVIVNIEMEAALPHHYHDLAEKKLDRVISYEGVYNFITKDLPAMGHIYLLETAAEQIIDFCFRDIRVQKVRARLEKTDIFPAASGAGIEIVRTRTEQDGKAI